LPRKRRFDWDDLSKTRPELIRSFQPGLVSLNSFLTQHKVVVLQPTDLGPLPHDRALEDVLLETIFQYQIDSNDAAIQLEAQRAGVTSIATLDADLRRAAPAFDVYTCM
jgi:hypothetical protein